MVGSSGLEPLKSVRTPRLQRGALAAMRTPLYTRACPLTYRGSSSSRAGHDDCTGRPCYRHEPTRTEESFALYQLSYPPVDGRGWTRTSDLIIINDVDPPGIRLNIYVNGRQGIVESSHVLKCRPHEHSPESRMWWERKELNLQSPPYQRGVFTVAPRSHYVSAFPIRLSKTRSEAPTTSIEESSFSVLSSCTTPTSM